jgi:hypothetical protein
VATLVHAGATLCRRSAVLDANATHTSSKGIVVASSERVIIDNRHLTRVKMCRNHATQFAADFCNRSGSVGQAHSQT